MKNLDAETVRALMEEKEKDLSEEDVAMMLAAEIVRDGNLAPSNDLYRRPRMLRAAARALYLRGYMAGIIRAAFCANK